MAEVDLEGLDEETVRQALRRRVDESLSKYRALHDQLWIAALLRGLATHGSAEDVPLAEPFLGHSVIDVRRAAARVIIAAGGPAQVDAMLTYATTLGADIDDTLAWAAGVLEDGDRLLWAARSAGLEEWRLGSVIDCIRKASQYLAHGTVLELLRHEREEVRMATLRLVTADQSRTTAHGALEALAGGLRYFDVVAVLDRLAYAPQPVADVARASLAKR
jgi:hypothetical protein